MPPANSGCFFSSKSEHQRDDDGRSHLDPLRQGHHHGHRRNRLRVQVVRLSGRREAGKVHGGRQVSALGPWLDGGAQTLDLKSEGPSSNTSPAFSLLFPSLHELKM